MRKGVDVRRSWTTGLGRASLLGRILDYVTYLMGTSLRLLMMRRPDVIISLTTPPMVAVLGLFASRIRGARAVYWVMDLYPDIAFVLGVLRPGSLTGRALSYLSRRALHGSDRVIALGETMARHLTSSGARRPLVIHEWEDGKSIRPRLLSAHPVRAALGWEGRFVVLYSGNMGLAHEFETLLDAAEILRKKPRILFVFVAAGPRFAEVEQSVRRRGLPNVEFQPFVPREDLGDRLTAADLHVVTLRAEAVGLVLPAKIYGILAAGRPGVFVGPQECEVAIFLAEGNCGERVAIGEASKLASVINSYASQEKRHRVESERARALFESKFDRPRAMQAFCSLIDGLGPDPG